MKITKSFKGTKHPSYFSFAVISDVHLGHQRTPTEKIIETLERIFPDNAKTAALDLIWITGDLFDKLLMLPEYRVILVHGWICRFLKLCKKHDILVRVLEGTPSHDYKQSRLLVSANEEGGIGADLVYHGSVAIERIERFDMTVLYVPDEMGTGDEVWKLTQQKLQEAGVSQVDFAMMHGCFEFQLPPAAHSESLHRQIRYEDIVRRVIVIGHDHIHKQSGKVWVPGSTERLTHGEEGPKGHLRGKALENRTEMSFVENVHAKIYKTVDVKGLSLSDTYALLDALPEYPDGSAIRIQAKKDGPIKEAVTVLKDRYFKWTLTFDYTDDAQTMYDRLQELEFSYTPVSITKDNLSDLIAKRFEAKGLDTAIRTDALQLLEQAM